MLRRIQRNSFRTGIGTFPCDALVNRKIDPPEEVADGFHILRESRRTGLKSP